MWALELSSPQQNFISKAQPIPLSSSLMPIAHRVTQSRCSDFGKAMAPTCYGFIPMMPRMFSNTTGYNNNASGRNALFSNTTGHHNIATGMEALYYNSTGGSNIATGNNALYSNTTGNANIATGNNALYSNSGSSNIATGNNALYFNTTGNVNIAVGDQALYFNTTGYDNIAIGTNALLFNSTASGNVAIGRSALISQSYSNGGVIWNTGNVAVGYAALYSNQPTSTSNGINNTAIGNSSLVNNLTGASNSGNATNALYSNTIGTENTATGYKALYSNTSGWNNTGIGSSALYYSNTGYNNTAIGSNALEYNNTGDDNTAIGNFALYFNTTGSGNTAIGDNALHNNVGGYNNIGIGYACGTHPNAPNIYNTIGIGNDDYLNGVSNQVIIGNSSTVFIGGKVNWGLVSDARIKNTIMEDVKGLDFILRLRPVTYHISNKAITTITGNKETPDFPGKYDGEKIKNSGFIAQEVEQAAKAAGFDFSGIYIPKKSTELYGLRYAEFVVPLVKAVQELSQQTIAQKKTIEQQQLQYEILLDRIEALEKKN